MVLPFFLADVENAAFAVYENIFFCRERKDRETWNCAWKEEFSSAENTFVCEGNCSRQTFLDTHRPRFLT